MIRLYHKSLKKICDKNGAIFIDLDYELDFDLEKDFYDSCHHTPSGSKKIGEYLYSKLNHLF